MTCKQARQLLAAYRREDLSPGENAELQAHLAECAECQAHAAQFQRIGVALQALPKLAPPPDFYARVMAAVQAEMPQAAERVPVAAPEKAREGHYPWPDGCVLSAFRASGGAAAAGASDANAAPDEFGWRVCLAL